MSQHAQVTIEQGCTTGPVMSSILKIQ